MLRTRRVQGGPACLQNPHPSIRRRSQRFWPIPVVAYARGYSAKNNRMIRICRLRRTYCLALSSRPAYNPREGMVVMDSTSTEGKLYERVAPYIADQDWAHTAQELTKETSDVAGPVLQYIAATNPRAAAEVVGHMDYAGGTYAASLLAAMDPTNSGALLTDAAKYGHRGTVERILQALDPVITEDIVAAYPNLKTTKP